MPSLNRARHQTTVDDETDKLTLVDHKSQYGQKILKIATFEIRQSTIYYAVLLGQRDKWIVDQASDVPSIIFFHDFLQNSLQKYFQSICLFKKKIQK